MKYCEKCGNELKEEFAFCDKCGAKVEAKEHKKEKKEKEEIKVEKPKKVEEKPIPPEPPRPPRPPKAKCGKGKIVLLTILNIILFAATITFLILWLTKPSDKDCKECKCDEVNCKDEPKKANDEYVGKWEQNVEYKNGSKVVERTYGMIELKDDGSFRSLFYDKDDISGTKEEITGTYVIKNNKITFSYRENGSKETVDYIFKNKKLCLNDACDDYLVKDSYNNKITIQKDDDDDDTTTIKTITYSEYENIQKDYEDAIVVVVQDGCSWCEKYKSVVEKIDNYYKTPVYFYKYDSNIKVSATPSTIIIKNGYPVETIVGYKEYTEVADILDENGVK